MVPQTTAMIDERDVLLKPSPVAMVWPGIGQPHQALAVPGVSLAAGDLLVEVELATVCGSDLHAVHGERPASTPLVLGHEQLGRIVAIGGKATAIDGTPLVVGMRVVWAVIVACGVCDHCRRGLIQACRTLAKYGHDRVHRGWELSGGFATHVHVLAGTATVVVDEFMPAVVAAPLSCTTATAAAIIEAATASVPLHGTTMLVSGAGMLGLTITAMATDAGATAILSEPDAGRRRLAADFGATATIDPSSAAGAATELAAIRASGLDEPLIAVEVSGAASGVAFALETLGVGGILVIAGSVIPGAPVLLDPESVLRRLLTVRGVHNYVPKHLTDAAVYLARAWHRHPFAELVGEIFPLARVDDALAAAAAGRHPRIGVSPHL